MKQGNSWRYKLHDSAKLQPKLLTIYIKSNDYAYKTSIKYKSALHQCFQKLIKKRKKQKVDPMIDGKAGFLVLDKNGMPYFALHWEKRFEYALGKYNRTYREELPKITPHVCRHTYCSNMAKSGVSPKTLQYLMGHADIATTLNVYTHLKYEDVEKEMRELEKKLSGE